MNMATIQVKKPETLNVRFFHKGKEIDDTPVYKKVSAEYTSFRAVQRACAEYGITATVSKENMHWHVTAEKFSTLTK